MCVPRDTCTKHTPVHPHPSITISPPHTNLEHLYEADSEVQVDLVAKVERQCHEKTYRHHARHVKVYGNLSLAFYQSQYLGWLRAICTGETLCDHNPSPHTLQTKKLAMLLNAMPEDESANGYSNPSTAIKYLLSRMSPVDTDMYNPQREAAANHRMMDTLNSIRETVLCLPLPSALTSAVTETMLLIGPKRELVQNLGKQLCVSRCYSIVLAKSVHVTLWACSKIELMHAHDPCCAALAHDLFWRGMCGACNGDALLVREMYAFEPSQVFVMNSSNFQKEVNSMNKTSNTTCERA